MLVDSSIWIEASKSNSKISKKLSEALKNPKAAIYTTNIIQLEVCQGARTKEQFLKLWDGFLALEFLEFKDQFWQISAVNYFKCKKRGITLSTVDCMIATLAQQYSIPLWSNDKIFKRINSVLGFENFVM